MKEADLFSLFQVTQPFSRFDGLRVKTLLIITAFFVFAVILSAAVIDTTPVDISRLPTTHPFARINRLDRDRVAGKHTRTPIIVAVNARILVCVGAIIYTALIAAAYIYARLVSAIRTADTTAECAVGVRHASVILENIS